MAFSLQHNGFLSNRDINFNVRRAVTQTPYVLADAVRIREVPVIIFGNAVKFTDDGGTIDFETECRPEDVQASLDAGMNGHLAKPIVIDEMVKTIVRNINR